MWAIVFEFIKMVSTVIEYQSIALTILLFRAGTGLGPNLWGPGSLLGLHFISPKPKAQSSLRLICSKAQLGPITKIPVYLALT